MSNEEEIGNEGSKEKPSILGIITSPKEQFGRIKQRPMILLPIIISIILVSLGWWLNSLGLELPEMEELKELEAGAGGILEAVNIIGVVFVGIFVPLFSITFSSVIHLLIAKIAQSNVSFKQLFSMNTFIFFITSIGSLFNGAVIAIIGSSTGTMVTSLASLVDVDSSLYNLLSSIEVFGIWTLILTAIGLHKVAGFSKGLAWAVPIIMFILGILISVGFGGLAGV